MSSTVTAPNLKAFKLYLKCWQEFWPFTLISVLFSLVVALQNTVVPLFIALALGQLIHSHVVNTTLLLVTAGLQISFLSLSYVFDRYGVALLHFRVEGKLYSDCFQYLTHQDYSFFADRFSGSIVTQASRFAKVYTVFNDTMFFDLLPQLFGVTIALVVMMHYSLPLGLTVLALWLFAEFVVVRFGLNRLPMRRSAVIKESEQVGELADVITNALTVKTFAAEERESERYEKINKARAHLFLLSWNRAVRNVWIVEALCGLIQLFMLVAGLLAVKHNTISVATFLLFQVYILRIIDNIRRSSFIVRQFELAAGDGQEMAELLEQPPLITDSPNPEPSCIEAGAINFENVTFQYPDNRQKIPLLKKFDLTIKPGEKIGLVGPSGGGKTTLTRLLLRFLDIQDGAIKIDGQNIRSIKQQDLRRAIAYVPQEPLLFHRSIKENIRYGRPEATDEEIIAVAKKSFAHEFIKDLPDGYDTLVGERGVKLSGGQRQRVAIARAMLTEAPILILDEATSALDSESEQYIQKALWELMKHKTAVVIAHRLSTIQRLDRIVVVDKGAISEAGTHQALLKKDGLYARLWKHQSGGFIEEI